MRRSNLMRDRETASSICYLSISPFFDDFWFSSKRQRTKIRISKFKLKVPESLFDITEKSSKPGQVDTFYIIHSPCDLHSNWSRKLRVRYTSDMTKTTVHNVLTIPIRTIHFGEVWHAKSILENPGTWNPLRNIDTRDPFWRIPRTRIRKIHHFCF